MSERQTDRMRQRKTETEGDRQTEKGEGVSGGANPRELRRLHEAKGPH